jgi:proteasome alpha subunit
MEYKAGSIGAGRNTVMEMFEDEYKDSITLDKSINLGLRALDTATEGGLNAPAIEIATVMRDQNFEKMDTEKVLKYVNAVLKKK